MVAYLTGDVLAFERIYARYSGKILAYLQKKIQNPEERDEVFQLVFFKFHKSRRSYDPGYPLLQWLYVITRSTYLDHLKRKRRLERTTEAFKVEQEIADLSQNEPTPSLSEGEFLSGLSGISKEVVSQRIMDESSYEEIAMKLNMSESNVRQIFSRTLRKLRLARKLSPGQSGRSG